MAKNKNSKGFNRTGLFNYERMLIQSEDKEGIKIYDLGKMLEEYDSLDISITVATDFPAEQLDSDELLKE